MWFHSSISLQHETPLNPPSQYSYDAIFTFTTMRIFCLFQVSCLLILRPVLCRWSMQDPSSWCLHHVNFASTTMRFLPSFYGICRTYASPAFLWGVHDVKFTSFGWCQILPCQLDISLMLIFGIWVCGRIIYVTFI